MPERRVGSQMSDKQIAYAVTHGRRVTFTPLRGAVITGYVCGSDNYHWLVAHEDPETWESAIALVHKSAPLVTISPRSTLNEEPESFRNFVAEVGGGFVMYCQRTFFGKTNPASTQEHTG